MLADILVGSVVLIITALAAGSVWKGRKSGGHCSGDCSQCGGCRHK